jgi:hypothetical protein
MLKLLDDAPVIMKSQNASRSLRRLFRSIACGNFSDLHATESPSTPLNLSTLSKSVDGIGSASLVLTTDSKQMKERNNLDSSVPFVYALWSREGSRGGNSGGTLDADMTKLIEVKEKARAKARAQASTEKKVVVVQKKRKRERQ